MSKTIKSMVFERKAADSAADIDLINRQSLKELTPEEVFTFSAILCDNEIDRDYERFSDACLEGLTTLFVGKTGIFNHSWDARNQVARIYKTEIEAEGETRRLRAYAYILRGGSMDEVIQKIEGGILREISVGVSVEKTLCSICGKDLYSAECPHRKRREYDSQLCYGILDGASDAYEFSFVAVPAQPAAGVTKALDEPEAFIDTLLAALNKCPDKLETLREKLAISPSEINPEPPKHESNNKKCDYAAAMAVFFTPKMKGEN